MDDYVFQDPRFGGLLARRGKRRARDIVSADRSPPSVPRGREVCVECFSLEGNGEKKKEREERRLVERRG